jgi:type II secretory pathway pseudopilin PulG
VRCRKTPVTRKKLPTIIDFSGHPQWPGIHWWSVPFRSKGTLVPIREHCRHRRRSSKQGFTLVLSLILMSLLVVVVLGLMGLSSISMRSSMRETPAATARANARLALMQALGQLQRTMGPDQRVSANAEILGSSVNQPFWTGTWRSTQADGSPYWVRDELGASWKDRRVDEHWSATQQVLEWLVSGRQQPTDPSVLNSVAMVGSQQVPRVQVAKLPVKNSAGKPAGNLAWWTGDLGVRANLGTGDPRENIAANPESPADGGIYRIMASQAADLKLMSAGLELTSADAEKLPTATSLALAGVPTPWTRQHAFDFTVHSRGVLADVLHGGLKQDLSAYFEMGEVPPYRGLPGLTDDSPLIGDAAATRYQLAGPRFGLLRDWAQLAAPFSGKGVMERRPEFDAAAGKDSAARALANEQPVKLAGNRRVSLQPILVEASNFTQMSCYLDRQTPHRIYQLRQLMYPRVVLWNPYNCELKTERAIIMIQGNGRQEMWTGNHNVNNLAGGFRRETEWINFEGGRSTSFASWPSLFNSAGYNDPYMGSYYFTIPATTFGPGECLVFSPAKTAEYDGLSVYRPGRYNLANNVLSCETAPDPSRCYYVSASDIDGGINFLPVEFWYAPTYSVYMNGKYGVTNQGDDSRAILKQAPGNGGVTFEAFDQLPQLAVLSASLQYGAGREPRIAWSKYERMPMQLLDKSNPTPTVIPNVRTREGIRLRWFQEHPSNLLSGALAGTAHFDEAVLANWNPRASFVVRSPWENVGGQAPWFFGAYTRDLFDQAVSWEEQTPVPKNGRYHGNPFGPPQEGNGRYVIFDVPREPTGVISLGQFQHAKLSELIWHPSYAVGNSLADPRLGNGGFSGLNRTAPLASKPEADRFGGFDTSEVGWSTDSQRSATKEDWATTARALLGNVAHHDHLVYDLSFESNQALWDRYFLSSGSTAAKRDFIKNPYTHPLPNGRMRSVNGSGPLSEESLTSFHRAATQLVVDGAFNVNSTRIEAWKALLGSTRRAELSTSGKVPFPRVLAPPEPAWSADDPVDEDRVWAGFRELDESEIGKLAEAIVEQVKLRGPFLSLADFINRRLAEDETGRMGALQAAIEKAGLNEAFAAAFPLDNHQSLPNYSHPDHLPDATRLEQTLKPSSKAWGAPAYLTQADLLQVLGPTLTARSDTFVIRAYGDAADEMGGTVAQAWCEAIVQRTPRPIVADDSGLNSRLVGKPNDFGRKFEIVSFRWLSPDEI